MAGYVPAHAQQQGEQQCQCTVEHAGGDGTPLRAPQGGEHQQQGEHEGRCHAEQSPVGAVVQQFGTHPRGTQPVALCGHLGKERALHEHEHETHLLAHLPVGLVHVLQAWRHRTVIDEAGKRAVLAAPHLDEGLGRPLLGPQCHAAHHLRGGESVVGSPAIHFEQKLLAHGAHGCHAAVPHHLLTLHHGRLVPGYAGQWPGCLCRHAQQGHQQHKHRPPGGAPLPGPRDEHHTQSQQRIACIGDGRAPWVVGDGEDAATPVLVVGTLVDTVALQVSYAVHRHPHLPLRGVQGDEAHIVLGRRGAWVALHTEAVEPERAGQGTQPVALHVLARRFALAQMQHSVVAGERGDKGSQQDDQQAQVQTEDTHGASPQVSLYDKVQSRCRRGEPQQAEPPRAIDHLMGHGSAPGSLHQSGGGHGHSRKPQGQKGHESKNPGSQRCLFALLRCTPSR